MIEGWVNSYPVPIIIHKSRNPGLVPLKSFPCGFFDGAAADNLGSSGFVIFISDFHFFSFSMGCGRSTNTRVELLALWALLRVSILMGIPMKLIYGDSRVAISWLNRSSALDVPSLMHWCSDIRHMIHLAPPLIFKHTFCEHNTLADELSKKALHLDMGFVSFSEILDGLVINQGSLDLF